MDFNDIITVAKKETNSIYKDRGTRRSILFSCLLIIIGPFLPIFVAILFIASPTMGGIASFLGNTGGMYINQTTVQNNLNTTDAKQTAQFMGTILLFVYVEMLTLFPSKIISETINGEVTDNNAEPILATPIDTGDLLLGKVIAANLAPNIPLYVSILVSSVLVDIFYGPIFGLLFPNTLYVVMLFIFVPLCVLADTVIVGILRLLFRRGWIQRVINGNLTPTQLVAYVYLGIMFTGLVGVITPARVLILSALFLAIILIGYPLLTLAYGRDNMIMKMKER